MPIWIETDLEPDDVLALALFPLADYYVAGEGNANIKYNRMLRYYDLLQKNDNVTTVIIEGFGSKKDFSLDGKEFDALSNQTCNENYLERFIKFALQDAPTMFSIKPMRELLDEFIKNPDYIKSLVSRVTLYTYGGFNFRCLFAYKKELLDLIKSFKKVCIYESYFVLGENNSMNKQNAPTLYNYLKKNSNDFLLVLSKLTYNWNKIILEDVQMSLSEKKLSPDTVLRHQKIIDNVTNNEDFQFVVANFGLAAIYKTIDPLPITNLKFETYTSFDWMDAEDKSHTNLYAYKNIQLATIEKLIIDYFTQKN